MAGQLVDSALEFDEEAKEYELKRLQVQGSCDNPFSEAREAESFEFIARKIDGTAAEIRSMPIGKFLWAFGERHWDDLRRIEKESVRRRVRLQYEKRRVVFDLEVQAARAETEPEAVPGLSKVAIARGQDSLVLQASGLPPFPIPTEYSELFRLFAAKVACTSPHESVGLSELNFSVTGEDSPSNKEKATDLLRRAIKRLNDELSRWAPPGDQGRWIGVRKRRGYYLNKSIEWHIADPGLEEELRRYSQSVWGINVDSETLEKNTPLRGQLLPAKSRHTGPRDEDDSSPRP